MINRRFIQLDVISCQYVSLITPNTIHSNILQTKLVARDIQDNPFKLIFSRVISLKGRLPLMVYMHLPD